MVTWAENIRATRIRLNRNFPPEGWSFTSEYAPMQDTVTVQSTMMVVIMMLLKAYLVKGTVELPSDTTRSLKFLVVGFLTKNWGGYMKSSSNGLNAVLIRYIRGSAVKHTRAIITTYSSTLEKVICSHWPLNHLIFNIVVPLFP